MLVFYLLLLFLLLGPLLFGRAVRQLGTSERLMLPGARTADGWDMESLKAYPERVDQLRGWVDRVMITWAPMDDLPRHYLKSGYLNPEGARSAPPIFQTTFRDVNGELIHLAASHLYEPVAQDARWLATLLQVPIEDDVAEGRPARVHARHALPGPTAEAGGPGPGYADYPPRPADWAGHPPQGQPWGHGPGAGYPSPPSRGPYPSGPGPDWSAGNDPNRWGH